MQPATVTETVPNVSVAADNSAPAVQDTKPIERPPVVAPEQVAAVDSTMLTAANDAIMPREPKIPVPTTAVAEGMASTASLIVMPPQLQKAEQNLAAYIGAHIAPLLTKGLELTLLAEPRHGATDVKLCLKGAMVAANPTLIGDQVLVALMKSQQFASFFEGEHKPHAQKPTEAGKEDMVHVHVPQLTLAQYAGLINALAAGITSVPVVTVAKEAAAEPVAQASVAEIAPVTAEVKDSAVASAATSAPDAAAISPSTEVKTPVEQHERVVAANEPQFAQQRTA